MSCFALFLSVVLHSHSGQYRPKGTYGEPLFMSCDSISMPFTESKSLVSCPLLQLEQPLLCRNALAIHPGQNEGTPRALQRV